MTKPAEPKQVQTPKTQPVIPITSEEVKCVQDMASFLSDAGNAAANSGHPLTPEAKEALALALSKQADAHYDGCLKTVYNEEQMAREKQEWDKCVKAKGEKKCQKEKDDERKRNSRGPW
jgi:hypothetical protein